MWHGKGGSSPLSHPRPSPLRATLGGAVVLSGELGWLVL